MALSSSPIHLSSFLLERNRWNGKGPSLQVSEWMEFMAEAGFRGLEIWSPHLLLSSRSEWEAIRDKSQEADLPVAFLLAQIPADDSDKSRRQRDFLIEAVDYFAPQGIKFTLTEGAGSKAEKISVLGQWADNLPREVAMIRAFQSAEWDAREIQNYQESFGSRLRFSLNPFSIGPAKTEQWFRQAGEAIVNLSVRVETKGKHGSLRDADEISSALVSLLRRFDFKGSWTLESTQGVGEAGENVDDLFDEAEEDLNFLIAALGRTAP